MGAKAVFVDRDGVLNEMVYDADHGLLDSPRLPEQVRLVQHAGAFLNRVRELGFTSVVVTNQPGVAKGTLTEAGLEAVNARLAELLKAEGGAGWDELRYCPYHPDGGPWARAEYVRVSEDRKPAPGMLLAAAREHGLDLASCWMVGDGLTDIQAGRAAGCRTILLTALKVEQIARFLSMDGAEPDFMAPTLAEAADIIARHAGA